MRIRRTLHPVALQREERRFPCCTALFWSLRQRIPHHPLESENPLSSSPNTHQICQSKPAALSHMGQLRQLSFRKSCQLYLSSVWRKNSLSSEEMSPKVQNLGGGPYGKLNVVAKCFFFISNIFVIIRKLVLKVVQKKKKTAAAVVLISKTNCRADLAGFFWSNWNRMFLCGKISDGSNENLSASRETHQ